MNKLFLFTSLVGFSFYTHAAENYLNPPAAPNYETCKQIVMYVGADGREITKDDPDCVARNNQLRQQYSAQVEAYNRSTRIITADTQVVTKPELHLLDCGTPDEGTMYNATYASCQNQNAQRQQDYNIQMSGYNKMVDEQKKVQQQMLTEQQQQIAAAQAASAAASLAEIQKKNQQAAAKYQKASSLNSIVSAVAAAAFAASCSGGATCQYGFLATSIAFGIFSAMASSQAGSHNASADEACAASGQLTSAGAGCSSSTENEGSSLNGATVNKIAGNFDANGNCIAKNTSVCDQVKLALPPGTNIKDIVKGMSEFASNPPFTVNKDGTVTTKDGKTYKPEDFMSAESMKNAGLSDASAKAVLAALNKTGQSASDLAKKELKDGFKTAGDADASGGGGTQVIKTDDKGPNGAIGNEKDINGVGKTRGLASEGLTRDFNGENIGVAGDDIFKMMNRRYKTKTAQDSFITK